jgi:SAM-dependent methyltransferase
MTDQFTNVYDDEGRARAYSELQFPGTYYLAFRDIPALLERHACGKCALDFGCGTGRSTRFLKDLGFQALGADISDAMLQRAIAHDPDGEYLLLMEGDVVTLGERRFDVILSAFTFDNIPSRRVEILRELGEHLNPDGRIINLVSAPEIYVNEWTSFSTLAFPENRQARSGELVRITMLDVTDRRPVEDKLWTDDDYRQQFAAAGLEIVERHKPLGLPTDPHKWVTEERISPWTIYVLRLTHDQLT